MILTYSHSPTHLRPFATWDAVKLDEMIRAATTGNLLTTFFFHCCHFFHAVSMRYCCVYLNQQQICTLRQRGITTQVKRQARVEVGRRESRVTPQRRALLPASAYTKKFTAFPVRTSTSLMLLLLLTRVKPCTPRWQIRLARYTLIEY